MLIDKNLFFQKIVNFISNVHTCTHALRKDACSKEITPQQNSILEYIFFSETVTASQIADCLNISLPNASRELKKLSGLELIVKEVNDDDRRKTTIRLSEQGQNLMLKTFEKIQKNFWEQVGQMSENEMEIAVSSMKALEKKVFFPK